MEKKKRKRKKEKEKGRKKKKRKREREKRDRSADFAAATAAELARAPIGRDVRNRETGRRKIVGKVYGKFGVRFELSDEKVLEIIFSA